MVEHLPVLVEYFNEMLHSINIVLPNVMLEPHNPVFYLDELHYLTEQILPDILLLALSILIPVILLQRH